MLRPDDVTNNVFLYCLAEAAKRFHIMILGTVTEGNHHHTVLYDAHGNVSEFTEHLHKMIAACMNRRWGRSENFWINTEPCLTRLLDRSTIIEKLIYVASNPVKDLLVAHATQWPGVNGYRALLRDKTLRAKRPKFFFSANGTMPEEVTLRIEFPEWLGTSEEVLAEIRAGVIEVEREKAKYRKETGAPLLGRERARTQSWTASPSKEPPRSDLRPRFAGGPNSLRPALLAYTIFLAEYREARRAWLAGLPAVFPAGTNRLRRIAPITLAPLPEPFVFS
ncbi:MAG: hypothetical protein AB7O24_02995 [Kofleriaceae bacterium]